jgi:hypothetical protein
MTKQDLSKMSLTACISIILTGGAAWFAFGRDVTTRPEVEAMIAQSLVPINLSSNQNAMATIELKGSVTELIKAQQGLIVEQRVLIERVNALVERIDKDR